MWSVLAISHRGGCNCGRSGTIGVAKIPIDIGIESSDSRFVGEHDKEGCNKAYHQEEYPECE